MKAEHRKELHTNLLADRVGRLYQNMRSAPNSTSILVWVFLLLAVGTLAVWQYISGSTQSSRSALWGEVNTTLRDPELLQIREGRIEVLKRIGDDHPGTIAGRTAHFEAARLLFESGQESITSADRSNAVKQIEEARELYSKLSKECADAPLLAQEALMGVAKADEALIGADPEKPVSFDQALKDYLWLAQKYPDSVLGRQAKERADYLEQNQEAIQKFYTELSKVAIVRPKKEPEGKLPAFP